jgi:AGCS family alanine or glycine:cation symporter
MAVVYVLAGLFILLLNYDQVIPAFGTIFSYAFNPQAGALGVGSGAFMLTLVWGIKRGLFSNEAGQGSAAIAHAAAKTEEPAREGVVASLGPFIDTLVVCTITALVIITTGVWEQKHPEQLKLNSVGISYTFDETSQQQNTLIVENGAVQNGEIIRNDFPVDTLFTNSAQTETFSGEIDVGDQIQVVNQKKEEVNILYGNIVENGAPLTAKGFEAGLAPLMPGGQHIVNLAVLLFAISTTISWSYYGDRSIQYLLGDKSIIYYKYFYVLLNFIGATLPLATVWMIGDIALGLMTFPNIIALFALSGTVYTAAQKYFKKMDRIEAEMDK